MSFRPPSFVYWALAAAAPASAAAAPASAAAAPASVPAPESVTAPAPPAGPQTFDTLPALCAAKVGINRVGPAPAVIVPEALLVQGVRQAWPEACRVKSAMLLGYFGTPEAVDVLISAALSGVPGKSGDENLIVVGALQGLGTYVRFHGGTPSADRALEFLLEASDHAFWEIRHAPAPAPELPSGEPPPDGTRLALVGLGLTGHPTARAHLAAILDIPSTDPVNLDRAALALRLAGEVGTPPRAD